MSPPRFTFDRRNLLNMMRAADTVAVEAMLTIDETGAWIRAVDSAHVALMCIKDTTVCRKKDAVDIPLDVEWLLKRLSKITEREVTLYDDGTMVVLKTPTSLHQYPRKNVDTTVPKKLGVPFDREFDMELGSLVAWCKMMKGKKYSGSHYVRLVHSGTKVEIKFVEARVVHDSFTQKLEAGRKKPCSGTYSTTYVHTLLKPCRQKSVMVKMNTKGDYPICFEYNMGEDVIVRATLAPRIEVD